MDAAAVNPNQEVRSRPGLDLSGSPKVRMLVLVLLLVVATFALYYPASHYGFVNVDDGRYVLNNPHIKYGLGWDTVKWAFSTFALANWHPLTWLSHALDCQFFFVAPGGPHEVNALFHAMNVLLLFWVLWRATGYAGRSLMVAALFALHPINVESVVWISERKNVLSMFFFLLALGAYTWYARKPRLDRYGLVTLLYACALMSKPQVITFPCVLLLWDYWPLQRMFAPAPGSFSTRSIPEGVRGTSFLRLCLEKVPLFALSAASAVITVKAQQAAGAMRGPFNTFPLLSRIGNAIVSYPRYLGKAIWPSHLAFMYPHLGSSLRAWQIIAAAACLLAITVLVFVHRRRRYLLVGWLWFLGTLIPMIGVVQVGPQAMADRYAYIPLIGFFIMICWGVADWASQRHILTIWLEGAGLVILVVLTVSTRRQISYWRNDVTLWSHTVQVTGPNYLAEDRLGRALIDRVQLGEALVHFQTAAAIAPTFPATHLYLGYTEQQRGNLRDAIEQYQKAISLSDDAIEDNAQTRDDAFMNMGYAYKNLGDPQKAQECFAAAESQRRQYAPHR